MRNLITGRRSNAVIWRKEVVQSNKTIQYIQENSPDIHSNLVGYGSNSAGAKL